MSSMLHFSASLSNINTKKKEDSTSSSSTSSPSSSPSSSPPPLSLHYTFSSKHMSRALAAAESLKPKCKEGDTILLNYSINKSIWTTDIIASWMYLRKVADTFVMEEKYDTPFSQMPREWTFCVCEFGLPDVERLVAMIHPSLK